MTSVKSAQAGRAVFSAEMLSLNGEYESLPRRLRRRSNSEPQVKGTKEAKGTK
jgi:hypothetical protein